MYSHGHAHIDTLTQIHSHITLKYNRENIYMCICVSIYIRACVYGKELNEQKEEESLIFKIFILFIVINIQVDIMERITLLCLFLFFGV